MSESKKEKEKLSSIPSRCFAAATAARLKVNLAYCTMRDVVCCSVHLLEVAPCAHCAQ